MTTALAESQLGPAERLLRTLIDSGIHLWHHRPGMNVGGTWKPAKGVAEVTNPVQPGLFVPAAVSLYTQLLEIYQINPELAAHFASYSLLETEWRDLKVACAALMLVQGRSGQPVRGANGAVEFFDDDFRAVGQGMVLFYQKKSEKALSPKGILRVAQLLEVPEIAALNRRAGFGSAGGQSSPVGRWKQAARRWLRVREHNLPLLKGLVEGGYKETIKALCRKAGYKPDTQAFFEILGWKQKQSSRGHRQIGLTNLKIAKRERFDGLTEQQICEKIVEGKLTYKDVVGRLPKEMGLTAAIMVACLPTLSNKDFIILTPTLEDLGLLQNVEVKARWEKAIEKATDQRAINVSKNVKSKELRETLDEAATNAVKKAVTKATEDVDVRVMFLIDKSGSMEGAIESSKEALSRILAGFPPDKVHIASFDTMGTVMKPKAPTRAGIQNMLTGLKVGGGTNHGSAVRAIRQSGVTIPESAHLIVIVAGDEAGEGGVELATAFTQNGFKVAAIGLILTLPVGPIPAVNAFGQRVMVQTARGMTVRHAAQHLRVPFTEVDVSQFNDPYQVPRTLKAMLEAPVLGGAPEVKKVERVSLVEKIMKCPLLTADGLPAKA